MMTSKFEFGLTSRAEDQPHNDRMNDQVNERTNELSEVSAGSKRLICELELVRDTLLIDVMTSKKRCFPNKQFRRTLLWFFQSCSYTLSTGGRF